MVRKHLILALGFSLALSTLSAADTYTFGGKDAAHCNVGFTITHLLISKVNGNFDKFDGTILYDEKNVENSAVSVSIDASSIDTRTEKRDNHLRSADFFDVATYPALTFKSTKVAKSADGTGMIITGDLTIHGVTKSVTLTADITGKAQMMGTNKIGFEAATTIDRSDFGIGQKFAGNAMVGQTVTINISGEGSEVAAK